MKKIYQNIIISLAIGIVLYFLSTNFFFKIPSSTELGTYDPITYGVGLYVAGTTSVVSFVLLCIFNRNNKDK